MRAHEHLDALAEAQCCADATVVLDEPGRAAVRTLSYGAAAIAGAALTAALLLGFDFTAEPAPECAVPVPATEIHPMEHRT